MGTMLVKCKSVMCKLDDMQDWQLILNGQFKKKNVSFRLDKILEEIELVMRTKAEVKKIDFKLIAKFENGCILENTGNYNISQMLI
jgi:hypothetical protein